MPRFNNRNLDELRSLSITPSVNCWAEGSVEIKMGLTHVICTASVAETTPKWITNDSGWISAEYNMLPRSNNKRIKREKGFASGRAQEISRLIGRSLRACVDLKKLGERQIQLDCDVLQADGGTRTASITGGFVALVLALKYLKNKNLIEEIPINFFISAISVGIINNKIYLDLDSNEDKNCDTDMNFVMTDKNQLIEVQGTAEKTPFDQEQFLTMWSLAQKSSSILFKKQKEIIDSA